MLFTLMYQIVETDIEYIVGSHLLKLIILSNELKVYLIKAFKLDKQNALW